MLQHKFDLAFIMKTNYFKKSVSELCLEETELLRMAWNNYVKRKNQKMEGVIDA